MIKKIIFISLISFFLINCSNTFNELNERVKGDGMPYLPGI